MNNEKLRVLSEQYPIIKAVMPEDPKNLYIVKFTGEWLTKKPSVCFILNHGRSRHAIEMIDFVSKTNQVIYNAVLPAGRMKMGECDNFSSWEGETLDEGMKKHDISDFGVILLDYLANF